MRAFWVGRRCFASVLCCVTVFCGGLSAAGKGNLVPNPSFEKVKVVDLLTRKDGLVFECEIISEDAKQLKVKLSGSTEIPYQKDEITKRDKKNLADGWTFYQINLPVEDVFDRENGHDGKPCFKFVTKGGLANLNSR